MFEFCQKRISEIPSQLGPVSRGEVEEGGLKLTEFDWIHVKIVFPFPELEKTGAQRYDPKCW